MFRVLPGGSTPSFVRKAGQPLAGQDTAQFSFDRLVMRESNPKNGKRAVSKRPPEEKRCTASQTGAEHGKADRHLPPNVEAANRGCR